MPAEPTKGQHRHVQMVFQDPYGALNPVHTVEYAVARPCVNYLGTSGPEQENESESS